MKKLITLSFIILSACLQAQVPQGINFQAIARNSNGDPMANSSLQIRLSVLDSAQSGTIVYQELRAVQTNSYGSFSFQIGINPAFTTVGNFQAIDWTSGQKHLKIDYDPSNSFNFNLSLGTIKFVSVPYAFTAKNVVFIDATGAQNGDALVYNAASGKFIPSQASSTIDWSDITNKPPFSAVAISGNYDDLINTPSNTVNVLPRIASKGQRLSVSFSGGDNLNFSQSSSSCPNAYANVLLQYSQGTPTIINATDKYYIDTKRFDAVFDIPSYVPSGLYDIIIAPSTGCSYNMNSSFKIY